jgi:hypothetical protein
LKLFHRRLLGIAAFLVMIFGLACLNYTKIGNVERHTAWAQSHDLPSPSRNIFYSGAALTVLGAAAVGYSAGRRRAC